MAAGDLVTGDYMYEYSALLLGSGTKYIVEQWDGLYGIPDIRANDLDRQDRHGVVPGIDLMGPRVMNATIKIDTAGFAAAETAIHDLAPVFRPRQAEVPMVWQRPRTGGSIKKYIYCRPRKLVLPTNYELAHGLGQASVQFVAADPRHYTFTPTVTNGSIATSATTGGSTFTVGGDFLTEPLISITGPFNNGIITLVSAPNLDDTVMAGRAIRLTGNVSAAQTLVIDFGLRTMLLNGAPIYSYRRSDSQWWSLTPGSNTVQFTRDAGAVGSAALYSITHRAAWIH